MQEEQIPSLNLIVDNPKYVTPELSEMFRSLDTKPRHGIQLESGTIREDH